MSEQRILFIDAARTYAIILALGTHALHVLGIPNLGSWVMNYPFFTSMATPMFVFMFGVMMEIVYVRRASQGDLPGTNRRLLHRAYQCYIAGALISVAALLGGVISLETFHHALIWIDGARYENMLMIYAGALLVMPAILRLRLRYGLNGLITLLLGTILTVHIFSFTKQIDVGYWGFFVNRAVGIGDSPGLSVLSAFIFILFGMIAGKFVRQGNTLYLFAGVAGSACLMTSLLIWPATSAESVKALMTEYAYHNLRESGDILFFLMGAFYSLAALCVIKFVVENFPRMHGIVSAVSPLGIHSLLAFAFGNIILNLYNAIGHQVAPPSLSIIVFFVLIWAVCNYRNRMPTYRIWHRLLNPRRLAS